MGGFNAFSNTYWMRLFQAIYQFIPFDSFNINSDGCVCEYLVEYSFISFQFNSILLVFKLRLIGYVIAYNSLHTRTQIFTLKLPAFMSKILWGRHCSQFVICCAQLVIANYTSAVYCIHCDIVHAQPQIYGTMTHFIIVYPTILCNLFCLSTIYMVACSFACVICM